VALATLAAAVIVTVLFVGPPKQGQDWPGAASVGGPFQLAAHDGTRVSSEGLKGKPYAIFFGFTHCPDICPTKLLELTNLMKDLGPAADRLQVLFVTVDPERDTVALLKQYLSAFDGRIKGLTGTSAEIADVAKAFRVYYKRIEAKSGDYSMDHTATVYLMDARGAFAGTLAFDESPATQLAKLKRLTGG
jgi:protein SCO1/2